VSLLRGGSWRPSPYPSPYPCNGMSRDAEGVPGISHVVKWLFSYGCMRVSAVPSPLSHGRGPRLTQRLALRRRSRNVPAPRTSSAPPWNVSLAVNPRCGHYERQAIRLPFVVSGADHQAGSGCVVDHENGKPRLTVIARYAVLCRFVMAVARKRRTQPEGSSARMQTKTNCYTSLRRVQPTGPSGAGRISPSTTKPRAS
jgi:hypothetical protein